MPKPKVKKIEPVASTEPLVHDIDAEAVKEQEEEMKLDKKVLAGVFVVLIALGIGTGYVLSGQLAARNGTGTGGMIKTDKVVGSTDTKTFKDSAEGTMQSGGLDGEGTHQLIREGGPSQTAYLISSVVDLDEYIGKKVKVWGQTIAAKKVSWLMDVGKVELLTE